MLKRSNLKLGQNKILNAAWIETPLSPMVAVSDEKVLYLLEFEGCKGLERELERLEQRTQASIIPGKNAIIQSIEKELQLYFKGKLKTFKTPLFLMGSPFQQSVWKALQAIPHGQTRSYADIARAIKKPSAFRAVANANGANQIAIVIPCHRVINSDGGLGGYGGGISRKQWLLEHETV